jgi:malate synthase
MEGTTSTSTKGIEIQGAMLPGFEEILTPDALRFVALLAHTFSERRDQLLEARVERQARLDAGEMPTFPDETAAIRAGSWTISPLPADLEDRRVEITGPSGDRKMVINALNCGASVFMADLEDANSPTWENTIGGQINVRDAIRRTISYSSPEGKTYALAERTAVLMIRPRGWHLPEKHLVLDGKPLSGGLVDAGLYLFHNAAALLERGTGPYLYLPKLESRHEARLWNDVFVLAERELGIPSGSIKATVLIETILASFEMDEILYELREHSAGLNCGRWDYIFSYIKKLRRRPEVILPDRAMVTMTVPFMRAYSLLCIKTCHRRGAPAMGGMSAYIPVRSDPMANEEAMRQVRADKEREARDGHDGTWVAHPGLVPVALAVFNEVMPAPNQIDRARDDVRVTAAELIAVPEGPITEKGLRTNISVGIQYIEAWLRGMGAVPINNLMEDAATAEISRAQVWQWIHHERGVLSDGRRVTIQLCRTLLAEELTTIAAQIGAERYAAGRFKEASDLFSALIETDQFAEFLTLPGYRLLN